VEGSTTYEWFLAEYDVLAPPEKGGELHGDRPPFVPTTRELPVPTGTDPFRLRSDRSGPAHHA
jgi:hypothetical protein